MAGVIVTLAEETQAELRRMVQDALNKYHQNCDQLLVCRLAELLDEDYEWSRDWVVYKIADKRRVDPTEVEAALMDRLGQDPEPPQPLEGMNIL